MSQPAQSPSPAAGAGWATIGDVLWQPSAERIEGARLAAFARRQGFDPVDYPALWKWSVTDLEGFWRAVVDFCDVEWATAPSAVLADRAMPGARWFPDGRLSYAAHLLRGPADRVAVLAVDETGKTRTVSVGGLRRRVARLRAGLAARGVGPGDRVAALLPNRIETLAGLLATDSLGAIFSSCSPDFGPTGVVDRFDQIAPRVLLVADGYRYAGRGWQLAAKTTAIAQRIRGLERLVVVDVLGCDPLGEAIDAPAGVTVEAWDDLCRADPDAAMPPRPFADPLAILYSSGTTGPPKSIVHGAGGTLVKHLCEHQLHCDISPGDVVFWFTTCGWMMWNWLVSALASGATIVLYDGSPTAGDPAVLWRLAARLGITHFGTSPRYLAAMADAGVVPGAVADLSALRSVLSTGAPLSPQQFDWVYANVHGDVQLASVSGGTDLIGCFAAGVPTLPVRRGELQGRVLGMAVAAFDETGQSVEGRRGELVCTEPFPSMPVGFWNDPDGTAYESAYFDGFPGVWTHGDFVEIRPSGGVVIYGRSDTTLNPGGVRIGTAELYRAIEPLPEVADSVVVGRPTPAGDVEVVLFVVPTEGVALDRHLEERIRSRIRTETTPRHVPTHIRAVQAVPYTISGKKVEKAVLQAISGLPVASRDALANPDALDDYVSIDLPPAGADLDR